MLRDARQHTRTYFFTFVKRKNEVAPPFTRENAMRACLPLEGPPDSIERPQYAGRLHRSPNFHAANRLRASSGRGSPLSIRSAITRNAIDSAWVRASASVVPYASTPASAGTSAIQRPSSSRSTSILSTEASPRRFRPLVERRCLISPPPATLLAVRPSFPFHVVGRFPA